GLVYLSPSRWSTVVEGKRPYTSGSGTRPYTKLFLGDQTHGWKSILEALLKTGSQAQASSRWKFLNLPSFLPSFIAWKSRTLPSIWTRAGGTFPKGACSIQRLPSVSSTSTL